MRFEVSPATEEEDSYSYRLSWTQRFDKYNSFAELGSGSMEFDDFDNAWEFYERYSDSVYFSGVELERIDSDGNVVKTW